MDIGCKRCLLLAEIDQLVKEQFGAGSLNLRWALEEKEEQVWQAVKRLRPCPDCEGEVALDEIFVEARR